MADVQVLRSASSQQHSPYIDISPSESKKVHVGVSRGPYVDAFVGEAWRDSGALLFGLAQQYREFLDCGHGNVSPVVARQKGLPASVSLQLHGKCPTCLPCPSGRGKRWPMPLCANGITREKQEVSVLYPSIMRNETRRGKAVEYISMFWAAGLSTVAKVYVRLPSNLPRHDGR